MKIPGKKSMQQISAKTIVKSKLTEGILATMSFFSIYNLPLSAKKIWELLYRVQADPAQVVSELDRLTHLGIIIKQSGLYSLKPWDEKKYFENQLEISKRWTKIKKYYWILSAIPFIEHVSVINSVAMGNADHESDIDFFIITKPNRLYFVRTMIILIFKLLGAYKSKARVNEQFCFGFYITSDSLSIKNLLLPGEDPYLVFWLGTIVPILSLNYYEKFIKENKWVYSYLPNFRTHQRLEMYRKMHPSKSLKQVFHFLLFIPTVLFENLLRKIHIRHTFKQPENSWKTSSTIANQNMLKLHALDPRKELRSQWQEVLQKYR